MFWRSDVSCCGATRQVLAITTNSKLNSKNRTFAGGMRKAERWTRLKSRQKRAPGCATTGEYCNFTVQWSHKNQLRAARLSVLRNQHARTSSAAVRLKSKATGEGELLLRSNCQRTVWRIRHAHPRADRLRCVTLLALLTVRGRVTTCRRKLGFQLAGHPNTLVYGCHHTPALLLRDHSGPF